MKILFFRLDHLGDAILSTPLARALHKAGHEVVICTRRAIAPLFDHSPHARAVALEDIAPDYPRDWLRLSAWMRHQRADVVMLPHARPRRLLMASLSSGIPQRIVISGGIWGRLLLHRCLRSHMNSGTRHYADIMLDFARALDVALDGLTPEIFLQPAEINDARTALTARFGDAPVVIVHPGTAGNTCNPNPLFYAEVIEKILARSNAAVVCTGITPEKRLLDGWPPRVVQHPRFWNAMGALNLRELAAHIACARTLVVPSTGPLHLAHALGIPSITPACRHPRVSLTIWGNLHPDAAAVSPTAEYCRDWRGRHAMHAHCQMTGQINSEAMWPPIAALLERDAATGHR